MATKAEKTALMARVSGSNPVPPIPHFPELPAFLKQKFPDHATEIDLWHAQVTEFFKKAGTAVQ
jgi:hypothetical protein